MKTSLLLSLMLACSAWGQYAVVTNSGPVFILDCKATPAVILVPKAHTTIQLKNAHRRMASMIISQPEDACFSVILANRSNYGKKVAIAGETNSGSFLRFVGHGDNTKILIVEMTTNIPPRYVFDWNAALTTGVKSLDCE